MSAQAILDALIALNQAEDEAAQMKRLSPRIKTMVEVERKKIPVSILAHHDRMRGRGRRSTVAVRHDVCSGCHISIAQGLRSRLRHKLDLNVCENCGSYMFLAEEIVEATPVFPVPVPEIRKPAAARVPARKPAAAAKPKKRLAMAR
jgi:hypothetical protein